MSLSEYHRWTNWIGTDESGKGDYFGSLVVAGVLSVRKPVTIYGLSALLIPRSYLIKRLWLLPHRSSKLIQTGWHG